MIRKILYPNDGSFESIVHSIHHYESSIFVSLENGRLFELKGDREYDYDRRLRNESHQKTRFFDGIDIMVALDNVLWCYTEIGKVERWDICSRKPIDVRIPVSVCRLKRPSPSIFVADWKMADEYNECEECVTCEKYISHLVAWGDEMLASYGDGIFYIWTSDEKFNCRTVNYSKNDFSRVYCIMTWKDRLCFYQDTTIYVMKKPWEVVFTIKPEGGGHMLTMTSTTNHLFTVHINEITKWDERGNRVQVVLHLPYTTRALYVSHIGEIGLIAWHGEVIVREKNQMYIIYKDTDIYDQLFIANGTRNTTIDGGICVTHTNLKRLVIWKLQPPWTPKLHSTFPQPVRRCAGLLMIMATKRECQLHILPQDILLLVIQFSAINSILKSDGIVIISEKKMTMNRLAKKRIEPENGEKEENSTKEPQKKRKKS